MTSGVHNLHSTASAVGAAAGAPSAVPPRVQNAVDVSAAALEEDQRAAEKAARRKSATDMVLADREADLAAKKKAAAEKEAMRKVAAERAAELRAIAEREQEEKAEMERLAAEREASERAIMAQREAELVAKVEAEAEAARQEAERQDAERRKAEADALEAERRAAERRIPGWVRRLLKPEAQRRQEEADRLAAATLMAHDSSSATPPASFSTPRSIGCMPAYVPERPKAVAVLPLLLRVDVTLDSDVVGKLPAGAQVYILQATDIAPGTVRCLITATPSVARPLGWVTALKNGEALLEVGASTNTHRALDWRYQYDLLLTGGETSSRAIPSAVTSRPPGRFFTSHVSPYAASPPHVAQAMGPSTVSRTRPIHTSSAAAPAHASVARVPASSRRLKWWASPFKNDAAMEVRL